MIKGLSIFLSLTLLIGNNPVSLAKSDVGGISLGGTRIIFDGSKDTASINVNNSSSLDVWLMRFWISPYSDKQNEQTQKVNIPFVITPPLYRLDPQSSVQLRINRLTNDLPVDRESVFYLNNLAIPPKKGEKNYQKSVQNGLQFAVNTRIKLFYRPSGIDDSAALKVAPEKLTVTSLNNYIVVKNPTPWFITMSQLSINGKRVQTENDTMLSPFGELRLPTDKLHGIFSYHTIDDRGMTTPKISKTF
ncbi:fimbrial biogenesis chaperone [Providencia sp. PROV117]|uniref:fimbrial biogenesis chaperone n=1 Tax=Providencia sp. PROV117 TaxID=2949828 RepID=UPI002349CA19|nr:molecular chaperone [Providencia sp. PROV117]